MCDHCGCGNVESFEVIPMRETPAHSGAHEHIDAHGNKYTHLHSHGGAHSHGHSREATPHTLPVHLPVLAKNDRLAGRNRGFLNAKGVTAINVLSSPGSGKTTLLARTLEMLDAGTKAAVIVGDLQTTNDANRLCGKGAPVVQVTTGAVCHLDAEMIARGLEQLDLDGCRLLFIENVGNLVCPASYDLGEALRVVLISVTEGEDKPLKYPPIFQRADAVVISKTDMINAAGFDLELARRNIRAITPGAGIIELSARTGEGMHTWIELLKSVTSRCG